MITVKVNEEIALSIIKAVLKTAVAKTNSEEEFDLNDLAKNAWRTIVELSEY